MKKKKISTFWLRGTTLASCMAIMSCAILVIPGSILMGQARIISCNSQNYSCDFSSYKAGKARDVLHIGMALTIIGTSFLIFSCIYGALSNKRVKKVQNELEKEILSHSHTESIS